MELQIEPIEFAGQESTVRHITRHLIGLLLSGQVAPGAKLPSERKFAAQLGIGRGTVRQAIQSLDLLGIVEVRPGDGTYLRATEAALLPDLLLEWGLLLRPARVKDLIEARAQLEPIVARLAATRRDETGLEALRRILNAMEAADRDLREFTEQDIAFHMKVAELAENAVLGDALASIRALLRAWIGKVVAAAGGTRDSFVEHVRVFEMLEKGDSEGAAAMMAAHLASASAKLMRSLEGRDDLGLSKRRRAGVG